MPNFFTEGGDMVTGLKSKVAFRVTDESGKGINFDGVILNQNNDTIIKFHPARFGIGSFIFIPAKNNAYKAVIKRTKENAVIKSLPPVRDNGTVLTVTGNRVNNRLKISIQTNTSDPFAYLIIHSRQHINTAATVNIQNGVGEAEVDLNKLGEGVSHITVFNNARQPVTERLYFKKAQRRLLVDAAADNQQYLTRKKVTIDVATKSEEEKTVAANMSIAVYLVDTTAQNPGDISYNFTFVHTN